jgi:hypothetical protein
MHQPGYVQGGQEVGRGYLLLGIHVRRIRSLYSIQSISLILKVLSDHMVGGSTVGLFGKFF